MLKKNRIVLLMAGLALICCLPAQAVEFKTGGVDWVLNGSLRTQTFYQFSDRGDNSEPGRASFILETPGNSWLRAAVSYQKIAAVMEIGLAFNNGDDYSFGAGVNENRYLRHAYVTYDLDGGYQVLVGRTWSLLALDGPQQRLAWDNGLWGAGDLFAFRHEQIQLSHKGEKVTFKVAIEDNFREDQLKYNNNFGLPRQYTTEDVFPALLASVSYSDAGFTLSPSGFIQSYKLKGQSKSVDDVTVTSYAGALNGGYKGEAFGLSAEVWYGRNIYMDFAEANIDEHNGYKLQRYGASTIMGKPIADATGTDIVDVDSVGGWLQLALFFGKTTVRTGAGYQQSETGLDGAAYEDRVHTWGVYANVEYPLFQTFRIIPGIAHYNWGQDAYKNRFGMGKNDLGNDTFVGAFFQYDF